ncbi:YegP family protein [Candidatus Bathyarchaeota archaeon]|nr:YegP family protein [Candidatus Bathyarchaeota archaeon]
MPEAVFEIIKDKVGKFRFHLKAANGEIVATSEAYNSKQSCQDGIKSVKESAPKATVKDLSA